MKTILLIVNILFFKLCVLAQTIAPISYSNFITIADNKTIHIHFVIDAGSTCNGISVLHSVNNIDFAEVYNIQGVCGSGTKSETYNFTHQTPQLNKTNYYKLFLGGLQYSESIGLYLKHIESNQLIVKSNPITNQLLELEFQKEVSKKYTVSIIDNMGHTIYETSDVTSEIITINTASFSNGKHYVLLNDNAGKLIKQSFLIVN